MKKNSNNTFDPKAFAERNPNNPNNKLHAERPQSSFAATDVEGQVREVTERIEAAHADITQGYKQWLHVGFALASELGEGGRSYFHRVSQMNSQYRQTECDKQYTYCLNSHGSGVGIATYFYLAKMAGVEIAGYQIDKDFKLASLDSNAGISPFSSEVKAVKSVNGDSVLTDDPLAADIEETELPVKTFSDKVLPQMPALLQDIAKEGGDVRERDMLLFASLVVLSTAMGKVKGVYDRRKVYACLYGYVVAPAASSKGILASCFRLLGDIDDEIRKAYEAEHANYEQEMAVYMARSKKDPEIPKPIEPPYRALRIPANGSATATYQALNDNQGWGITSETEGDALGNSLKSDYGDYSEGLRSAAHHEPIQYNRRKENEHVFIKEPRWTVFLTSTPDQLNRIFTSTENGLFSRFLFLQAPRNLEWHDVFAEQDHTIEEAMEELGHRVYALYTTMNQHRDPITFTLPRSQQPRFNQFFKAVQTEFYQMLGDDIVATVRRLGLSAFRMMMILSFLRLEGVEQMPDKIECRDEDFETAITIIETLLEHAAQIYHNQIQKPMAEEDDLEKLSSQVRLFYQALPNTFGTKEYKAVAKKLGVTPSRASNIVSDLYLKHKLLERLAQGQYRKIATQTEAK